MNEGTFFYDLDHKAGVVPAPTDEGTIEIYLHPNDPTPYASAPGLGIYLDKSQLPPNTPLLDPYYVRRYHPSFGCLSTVNLYGAKWALQNSQPWEARPASIVIPYHSDTPGTGLPTALREIPPWSVGSNIHDYLTSQTTTISIGSNDLYIADSSTTTSLTVPSRTLLPSTQRSVNVIVDYLSSGKPSVERTIPGFNVILLWGVCCSELESEEGFGYHHIDRTSPLEETVMISVSEDGYSTDTIILGAQAGKNYTWTPLLSPLPGSDAPYPGGIFPDAGILSKGVADELLGDCSPGATLKDAHDPNEDGIQDAADLVAKPPENQE